MEVMVEGYNRQRGQVIGRSSQNKTVNFTTTQPICRRSAATGRARHPGFPNSLWRACTRERFPMTAARVPS